MDTLVEFYFRVFDEDPKIDFFVCTYFSYAARKNIFEPHSHLHFISWKYKYFLEFYYLFLKKLEFLTPKKSYKNSEWIKMMLGKFGASKFFYFSISRLGKI